MKKLFLLILMAITLDGIAQENKEKVPTLSMSGGIFMGVNKTTAFVGFIGPKFTVTFPVSEKLKIETGLNGIPGLVLGKDPKLGLSAGGTITFKYRRSKIKPVIGMMFVKTNEWQMMYGVGFVF